MSFEPLRPPVVFPARVNGQQSMVNLTGTRITWQPAPAEFSSTRIDGGVIDVADITDIGTQDLGAAKVLRLTAAGVVTRVHAAAELVDKLAAHLRQPPE